MKRSFFTAVLMMVTIMLAACSSGDAEISATPETTPTQTATPEPVEIEVIPTTTPAPQLSYTTGLPYDGDYHPVMAVISNAPAARPQTGLQTADVVYEMPIDYSVTRFVCVFSDNVPEGVMSVRSARVSFLYIQQEWDAVFLHFGGSGDGKRSAPWYTYYGSELLDDVKIDVNSCYESEYSSYYTRVDGIAQTHNVMMFPLLAQQLYDYDPEPLGWLFDSEAAYAGSDVTQINLKMCTNNEDFVSYTYDAENDVYLRFMNGEEFKSAETGQQVTVRNVIVQYSTYDLIDIYKIWDMTGSGDADIYIGGKLIEGTWEKASAADATIFRDNEGNQIVLRPGNTWIHIHPEK